MRSILQMSLIVGLVYSTGCLSLLIDLEQRESYLSHEWNYRGEHVTIGPNLFTYVGVYAPIPVWLFINVFSVIVLLLLGIPAALALRNVSAYRSIPLILGFGLVGLVIGLIGAYCWGDVLLGPFATAASIGIGVTEAKIRWMASLASILRW